MFSFQSDMLCMLQRHIVLVFIFLCNSLLVEYWNSCLRILYSRQLVLSRLQDGHLVEWLNKISNRVIHDLHAFCCQLAPSVWFWELWHSRLCEENSNNVIVDVTDTPDDIETVRKSGPRHTVQHGVIWSARKHDKLFQKGALLAPCAINVACDSA